MTFLPHVSSPGAPKVGVSKLPLTLPQIDGQLNTHRLAILEWKRKGEGIEARRVINDHVNPLLDQRLKLMGGQGGVTPSVTVVPLATAP